MWGEDNIGGASQPPADEGLDEIWVVAAIMGEGAEAQGEHVGSSRSAGRRWGCCRKGAQSGSGRTSFRTFFEGPGLLPSFLSSGVTTYKAILLPGLLLLPGLARTS